MDIAFDTTWCPVCSRQILPKRIQVPIQPPEPSQPPQPAPVAAPAPPPTTPTAPSRAPLTRTKTGTGRKAGGLVHGTGRVKPNGALRRSPLQKSTTAAALAAQQPPPSNTTTPSPSHTSAPPPPSPTTPPVRHRTIIDQTPVPLYCSDECRLADLQSSAGIAIDYHPARVEVARPFSPPLPPVPHNSFVGGSSGSESSLGSASSVGSAGLVRVALDAHEEEKETEKSSQKAGEYPYPLPRGYAALASIYDLPPPPPPLQRSTTASSSTSTRSILTIDSLESEEDRRRSDPYAYERPEDYCSGVMMAARRIKDAVCTPKEKKRPSWATPAAVLSTAYAQSRVIPGWTDGSDRWRASVYSLSAPASSRQGRPMTRDEEDERIRDVYSNKGGVATPLRSKGVYSTLGESSVPPASSSASVSSTSTRATKPGRARSEAEELYARVDMSFARRAEARVARSHTASVLPSSLSHHTPSPSHTHHGHCAHQHASTQSLPPLTRKKEVSILKKGAEGRLLVPDVKLKRTDSAASFRAMEAVGECCECCVQRSESVCSSESESSSVSRRGRPMETPSWSYDPAQPLYPILDIRKTEKRVVREAGPDGVMREREVEVEVPRKRLFMFPGARD